MRAKEFPKSNHFRWFHNYPSPNRSNSEFQRGATDDSPRGAFFGV
jgi:hypothetical protein